MYWFMKPTIKRIKLKSEMVRRGIAETTYSTEAAAVKYPGCYGVLTSVDDFLLTAEALGHELDALLTAIANQRDLQQKQAEGE